ncbi:HD domain-containing protein [bacterium]|nr:HD domain-containing protein [bacterium]
MKIIRDSLWGDIEVSDLALAIIDTPHFQRLHYIRQTGFSYKVFPGANTSRFEHSLGVYEVTRNLLTLLVTKQPELRETLDERTQEIVCIAGLIHDLGHGPFSHLFDHYVSQELEPSPWTDHETRSLLLLRDLVRRYAVPLSEQELDTIERLVLGTHPPAWYATLINNQESGLDTDKIDYVLRDARSFGMKTIFDPSRLLRHNTRVIDDRLCFCDRVRDEIITLFLVRNKMNRFIYRHPRVLRFEHEFLALLRRSSGSAEVLRILRDGDMDGFLALSDASLLATVRGDDWWAIECRRGGTEERPPAILYRDTAWENIRNLWFYRKKEPGACFRIEDWNHVSPF